MWNGLYTKTEFEKPKEDNSKPSVLSELLECQDDEIGKAAKQFSDEQGNVPTAFAFQAGARWVCEYKKRAF